MSENNEGNYSKVDDFKAELEDQRSVKESARVGFNLALLYRDHDYDYSNRCFKKDIKETLLDLDLPTLREFQAYCSYLSIKNIYGSLRAYPDSIDEDVAITDLLEEDNVIYKTKGQRIISFDFLPFGSFKNPKLLSPTLFLFLTDFESCMKDKKRLIGNDSSAILFGKTNQVMANFAIEHLGFHPCGVWFEKEKIRDEEAKDFLKVNTDRRVITPKVYLELFKSVNEIPVDHPFNAVLKQKLAQRIVDKSDMKHGDFGGNTILQAEQICRVTAIDYAFKNNIRGLIADMETRKASLITTAR
jgi:hypothetical protein